MLVNQICKNCNKPFMVRQAELNRGNGKFCSKSCACLWKKLKYNPPPKEHNTVCDYCGKSFYRGPFKKTVSKSGLQFCCRKCKDMAQRLESGFTKIHPSHYGNTAIKSNYRSIALEHSHHRCNRCGYNKILSVLVVHHKDRNKQNNDISNLEILCRNCHYEEHMKDGYSIP